MTFDTKTPTTPATTALKPEHHHTKVAEHLEMAAKSHKEAAKCIGSNDHTAAHTHVKAAHEHVAKAHDHVVEAAKKTTSAAK